jgi:hypothetical protein
MKLFAAIVCLSVPLAAQVQLGKGVQVGGSATAGVSSIDTNSGAFTFGGPGVSHSGNAYTFGPGALTLGNIGAGASTSGLYDFSAATHIKLPSRAGYTAAVSGEIGYNSTDGNDHFNISSTDLILLGVPSASLPTSGQCAQFQEIGAWWQLIGVPCGGFITSITTTGTSGPATVVGGVLNVPQYSSGISGQTINSIPLATSPTGSTISSNLSQSADGNTLTFNSALPGCISLSASQICLTAPPYNASPDGATTTTTSATFGVGTSGTIGSCSSFRINQGVLITGAGTSGANYIGKVVTCIGTTLTVTPATSTSVASGVVVQHDETAAFLAAIAALPNGGTIQLPSTTSGSVAAIYLVNGPLLDTSCANAVLPMPKIANYTANPIVINIKGLDTPGGTAVQSGEIIQTSTPSGNLFGGCDSATGGGFPPFTNVKLNLENLTLSSYTNPGVVMVNATSLQGFIGKHLYVNMPTVSLPSNAAGGAIWLPAVGNNVEISLDDVQAAGYYTLYKIGEHAHLGAVYGSFGVNCFQFDNGTSPAGTYVGNSAAVNYMWAGQCTNEIVGPSTNPMTVNILVADLETASAEEINDSHSLLHGIINFTIPQNAGVAINCTPRIVGGANLTLHPLQCQPEAALPPGPPSGLIENWKSQEGTGTTLANSGSDSTNSVTTTNVTWASAAGFTGLVATYNGSTSTATAASATNTNFTGSTPFSICQWVNPSALASSGSAVMLANTSSTTGIAVEIAGSATGFPGAYQVFLYSTLSNFINVSSNATTIPVGSATLACFTYSGTGVASGITSYINGVPVANTVVNDTLSGGSIASGLPIRIGSGGGTAFSGAIGRVRIFNRLLSGAEISAMFAAGTTAY